MAGVKTSRECAACHSFATDDPAVADCPVCGNGAAGPWASRSSCLRCGRDVAGTACPVCDAPPPPPPPWAEPVARGAIGLGLGFALAVLARVAGGLGLWPETFGGLAAVGAAAGVLLCLLVLERPRAERLLPAAACALAGVAFAAVAWWAGLIAAGVLLGFFVDIAELEAILNRLADRLPAQRAAPALNAAGRLRDGLRRGKRELVRLLTTAARRFGGAA